MNSSSIHSPADSLVLSSSFHSNSKESLSPPSTPGHKRSYYPDQLSPMPEFFSTNVSLLPADLLVKVDEISEEEEAVNEATQMEWIARRPMPSLVLRPKSSSKRMNMKLKLEQLDHIELPYSEPSPAPPTHQRMVFTSSLPRLPSLSEHNDVRSSSANKFLLESEHIQNEMVIDDDDKKKNTKLPAFQRKGTERKQQSEEVKRSSLVARCA